MILLYMAHKFPKYIIYFYYIKIFSFFKFQESRTVLMLIPHAISTSAFMYIYILKRFSKRLIILHKVTRFSWPCDFPNIEASGYNELWRHPATNNLKSQWTVVASGCPIKFYGNEWGKSGHINFALQNCIFIFSLRKVYRKLWSFYHT